MSMWCSWRHSTDDDDKLVLRIKSNLRVAFSIDLYIDLDNHIFFINLNNTKFVYVEVQIKNHKHFPGSKLASNVYLCW